MRIKAIIPAVETPGVETANLGLQMAINRLDPDTKVDVTYIEHGFECLNTVSKMGYNVPGILQAAIRAEEEGYDGVFLVCLLDPGMEMIREMVHIPVFGGFRTSMMMALGCGKRASYIYPAKFGMDYGDRVNIASVFERNPEFKNTVVHMRCAGYDFFELCNHDCLLNCLVEFAEESLKEHFCDSMILGCTAMAYVIDDLRAELKKRNLNITVLEPVSCGLRMLELYIKMGLSNSLKGMINVDMADYR